MELNALIKRQINCSCLNGCNFHNSWRFIIMKLIKLIVVVLALSLSFASLQGCQTTKPKEKIVFQVSDNDPAKWNLALNNAKNVQQAIGSDKVEAEIVVYGPGIGMLKADSTVGNRVEEAKKSGVAIVACQNTMKGMKLTEADMLPNTSYVPAGVVEIMAKQKAGAAYVRP